MTTYFRVKKDTFLWEEGAILFDKGNGHVVPIEDIWNKTENQTEYITRRIVEDPNNADYFEKVYKDSITGNLYKTKDQLVSMFKAVFKS